MKIPKKQRHYCPKCKKHTDMAVSDAKKRTRSTAHPMSRGSKSRIMKRGLRRGFGNLGRYSKPPISKFKRTGAKVSTRSDLRFKCAECSKTVVQKASFRSKKREFI
jgi:large subunit ribosomal protein L44e